MDKENQLYIGQVSKLLDISSNTLRFFDKEGVVKAKRAENGYRYYDDWDINFLIEYKKYRSFGLTVEDTKDILYEDSLISMQNRLKENEKKIEEKIRYDYMLLEYNKRYCVRLKSIEDKIERWVLTDMVEMQYFPMRYNKVYLCKTDVAELFGAWSKAFPFVEPILIVNQPFDTDYECALSIRKEYLDAIHLPKNHLVQKTSAGKAVNTVIVGGDKDTFSTELLTDTFHYIQEQGYCVAGPTVGYYLARVHEDGRYRRYIDVYIPINSSDKMTG